MIKVLILLIGAAMICYGRPSGEGGIHVVYSKRLNEVRTLQAEPRSGIAYVYSITASESPSLTESASFRSYDILFPREIGIKGTSKEIVAPIVSPIKDNLPPSKQIKEKKTPFLYIDPLDPKANESGNS